MKQFRYGVRVEWMGNDGRGTAPRDFGRDHEVSTPGKGTIIGSAPPEFSGDGVGWAPEDMLVAAVSQCHMLTYLYLCSRAGIVVEEYRDDATGVLQVQGASGGRFEAVRLRPFVAVSDGDVERAVSLHAEAHAACYVSRSVSFPVEVEPTVVTVAIGLPLSDAT